MQPRLFAIAGPLKEKTIFLPEGDVTMGRDVSNGLSLIDLSVSRKHCLFRSEEGRIRVRDLESRSGTIVNGTSVKERWLHHGDEIAVGDSIFLFFTGPANTSNVLAAGIAGISTVALDKLRNSRWLERENQSPPVPATEERSLVGESAQMKGVYQLIAKVAPAESTVLIEGESGTGKELAARALHQNSPRANNRFVAINCAAIPESLLESDLFGHERGAFTGAATQKKGRLEVADGGVVFLDEVGELAPSLQVKLLRVLQEKEFERVGATHSTQVDIRLIAATNRDLDKAVACGQFRRDLYYRLAVVRMTMPTLRERTEDIPLLTRHFLQRCSQRCGVDPRPISREAMACLMKYDWPGNVRELENAIERALVLGRSESILPEDLPDSVLEGAAPPRITETKYYASVRELKIRLILDAVEQARGSYVGAAELLGLHPNYLHRLIRNLAIRGALNDMLQQGAVVVRRRLKKV
ncbi:MAG TPA: sigma 54-interacting transcriptional regulator [Candidatus Sulfotelmatobacter sp.]|nr:sigma 54-interacting transcriptional regulator [Candidatus Sulfotelmatobacter sp.]